MQRALVIATLLLIGVAASVAGASSCCAGHSTVGGAGKVEEPGVTLRVMSFNVRYGTAQDGDNAWDLRRDLVVDTIEAFDPDLLGVQECLDFQGAYLLESMAGYGFVGVGRDDGSEAGEMCAILYRKSGFELVTSGHFWLSETPDIPGSRSWDSALPRMVSWVRLRTTESAVAGDGAADFLFLNTHFDHAGETARVRSAELLRARAGELAGGDPIIIAGDFNAPAVRASDGPFSVLAGEAGGTRFVDTYGAAEPEGGGEGTFNAFEGRTTGARIDWILVSTDVVVGESGIDRTEREGRYPSDHFPVTAVVGIAPVTATDAEAGR